MPARPKAMSEYADTTALTRLQELADEEEDPPIPDTPSGEFVTPQAFRALKVAFEAQKARIKQLENVVGRLARDAGLGYRPE